MKGCAGAGSTQARTLTCRSPPPLALHPCLDLYGFRVLSNSDRAPVFLFVLCTRLPCPGTCLDQAGTVWAGSGFRVLVLIEIEPGLIQTRPVGSRPLVFFRWCPDWMPPVLNKWTCLRQVGARFGLGLAPGCSCLLSFSLPGVRTRRVQGLDLGPEGGIVQTRRVPV